MQGKGLIKFVTIALTIACLYSLSFTWIAQKVEKDAKAYDKGDVTKEKTYLDHIIYIFYIFHHILQIILFFILSFKAY